MLTRLLFLVLATLCFACDPAPTSATVGQRLQFSTSTETTLTVEEGGTLQVYLAVLGANGREVAFSLGSSPPAFALLDGNLLTLTPLGGDAGTHSLTVTASAGDESDSAVFALRVLPATGSTPPPAAALPSIDSNFGLRNEDLTWVDYSEGLGHFTRGEPRFQLHAVDAQADAYRLYLEVRPEAEPFQRISTHESGWVQSAETATVALTGLTEGQRYKLQWRLVDESGAEMDWYFSSINVSVWTVTAL